MAWSQDGRYADAIAPSLSRFANCSTASRLDSSCPVFSLGDHRRQLLGASSNLPPDYFQLVGRSAETEALREKVKLSLEDDVEKFFSENRGQVAIYDANVSCAMPVAETEMYADQQVASG